ncbi:MAG: anti-sigma factor [Gemmatimonadota bacterium]|nr:MAG: anti-sigma factor [Gemmatimonadota bacterium]
MNVVRRFDTHISLALAAALGLGLAACEDLTDPNEHRVGVPAPEVALDVAAAGGVPSGGLTLENFKLVVDTAGIDDVFQREAADGYYSTTYVRYYVHTGVRIAGQDPRLPALAPVYAPEGFVTQFAYFWGPERYGDDIWDFYMRWDGLEPVATYTYALERLATHVNGVLDAVEFLLEGEVSEPDSLAPLDGTAGGYPPTDLTWPAGGRPECALNPIPDPPPNPWYLGPVTANADGRITADFCMGTPWPWYTGSVNVPDSSIAALNELRRGVVPQYNYIVVYEGEPANPGEPPTGPPVIRIQLGVDLDPSGVPIPNSFAPFPVWADREAALDLPDVSGAPSRIRYEIRDLEPLAGDAPYEAWLLNVENGNSIPAMADYFQIETIIVTDELGQQTEVDVPGDTTRAATFEGVAASNVRHAFILRNPMIDPQSLGGFTHVVLAKPGVSGSASEPVFWAQFLDQSGTPEEPADDIFISADDFKLGALDLADPTGSRTFRVSGSGDGAIWEDQLGLQFRRLSRPPPGYVYEVWLVDAEGEATSLGPITGPKPEYESITDADSVVHVEFMTGTQILQAAKIVDLTGATPFDLSQFSEIQLTLEPKAGTTGKGPTLILSGRLPE